MVTVPVVPVPGRTVVAALPVLEPGRAVTVLEPDASGRTVVDEPGRAVAVPMPLAPGRTVTVLPLPGRLLPPGRYS